MSRIVSHFLGHTTGTTAIEYSLIAGGIALAILAVINSIGSGAVLNFFTLANTISPAG